MDPKSHMGYFFLRKMENKRSKKVKKRSKMAFFHVFRPFQTISRKVIGRRRLYLVDISQIHLRSVIYNELNQNSKTSGYGASEKSDCVEKTRFQLTFENFIEEIENSIGQLNSYTSINSLSFVIYEEFNQMLITSASAASEKYLFVEKISFLLAIRERLDRF